MYTAREAREKAEHSISDETKKQLDAVKEYIEYSVNNGKMYCYFPKRLNEQAVRKIEELGYTVVDDSTQRDGVQYKISWAEAQ